MEITILHEVKQSVLDECSRITGCNVTLKKPDNADIQIVLGKFVPTSRLKMVQTVSAGVDHLKYDELPDGVVLCSNAGAFSEPVAEHTFALLLAHIKKICTFSAETRNGIYRKQTVGTLTGLRFGILGHGGIGKSSARIAKALGMTVLAYTRSVKPDENVDEFIKTPEELFKRSDVLLIALPKTKETLKLVNSGLLDLFNGEIIINVARADIVDEADMRKFLKEKPDVHYLTDVWWKEPDITKPIPENATLTPHVGGISRESADQAVIRACRNVRKFLDGAPDHVVDIAEYR